MTCDICGIVEWLPFTCSRCGGKFCSTHRLPEKHFCSRPHVRRRGRFSPDGIKKEVKISRSKQSKPSGEKKIRQPNRRSGYKNHRKPKLFVKILLVVVLLCGGLVIAWKSGTFSDEINQQFDTVVEYLRWVWVSTINLISPTESPSPSSTPSPTPTPTPIPDPTPAPDPTPEPVNLFVSVDELITFLDNDNVSDVIYASDFTCGDFAEALVGRAYNTGYDLKVYSMFDSDLDDFKRYVESLEYVRKVDGGTITTTFVYGYGSGHAVCKAEIGSDTYLIEPQSDQIFRIIDSGYEIVYFGEVTK